ncbi:hypothetical protein [Mycolicibacterium phlei]
MTTPLLRRRARRTPIYRISRCLGDRGADVSADGIAPVVAGWLAELGADSPLVADLARAVIDGNWVTAHALAEILDLKIFA